MVSISLQLAEKQRNAGVLDDQEARAAGSAHGQGEHGAIDPDLWMTASCERKISPLETCSSVTMSTLHHQTEWR